MHACSDGLSDFKETLPLWKFPDLEKSDGKVAILLVTQIRLETELGCCLNIKMVLFHAGGKKELVNGIVFLFSWAHL